MLVLRALIRYPNPMSAAAMSSVRLSRRSHASTDSTAPATSCPYAPMFCTTEAPTVPGMPDRPSTPSSPSSTVNATKSSQLQPASALTCTIRSPFSTGAASSGTVICRRASRTTTPLNGPSATSRLDPPPITHSGSPLESASSTASITPTREVGSMNRAIWPPTPIVVRSAKLVMLSRVHAPVPRAAAVRRPGR